MQEKLNGAIYDITQAKDNEGDFGGHRDEAEKLLKQAQHEIEEAVVHADQHGGGKWH